MVSFGFWIRNLLWPERNLSKLGRLMGALSVLTILREGFGYTVSNTFAAVAGYYDRLIGLLTEWAAPLLEPLAEAFGEIVNAGPSLYPHWNHILVLLGIYFFRNAANNTQHEGMATRVFKQALSGLFALVLAAATGIIPLDTNDMAANFAIAAIPIAGAWLYDIVYLAWHATFLRRAYAQEYRYDEQKQQSWTTFFLQRSRNASVRYVAGLLLALILLQIPQVQALQGSGLLVLGLLVIVLGVYWMGRGLSIRRRMIGEGQAPESLPALPSIKLGGEMLGIFLVLSILLLIDGGLRAAGF